MSDSGLEMGLAMIAPVVLGVVIIGGIAIGVGGYLLGSEDFSKVSPDKATPVVVKAIHPTGVQNDILIVPNGRMKLSERLAENVDIQNLYYLTFDKYNPHVCPSETYNRRECYRVEQWKPDQPSNARLQFSIGFK